MFATPFIALAGKGHLIGIRTPQTSPRIAIPAISATVHCNNYPRYDTECPWFEHIANGLPVDDQYHCPYVKPDASEINLARRLQRLFSPTCHSSGQ